MLGFTPFFVMEVRDNFKECVIKFFYLHSGSTFQQSLHFLTVQYKQVLFGSAMLRVVTRISAFVHTKTGDRPHENKTLATAFTEHVSPK